jgi:hypothetical protein
MGTEWRDEVRPTCSTLGQLEPRKAPELKPRSSFSLSICVKNQSSGLLPARLILYVSLLILITADITYMNPNLQGILAASGCEKII